MFPNLQNLKLFASHSELQRCVLGNWQLTTQEIEFLWKPILTFSYFRAFLKINDDKIFLVEQKKAAGLGFTIFDDIFSDGTFDR